MNDNTIYRWVSINEIPEDWEEKHWRYADDHIKLDTDLFYLKDGKLQKKGGYRGALSANDIELLEPIEADQQEVWKDVSFKIVCGDDISELQKNYTLIKNS